MILNNKKRRVHQQGVTLIELLVTLVIMTIGIAALIKFQGTYFYYTDLSQQQAEALVLAKSQMATLRNFQVLTTTTGYNAYADILSGTSTASVGNTTYTENWTVTTNSSPAYKTVTIVVSWPDRRGTTQSVSLTSIISKMDPANSGVLVYDE